VTGKRRFRVRLVLEGLVVVSSILLAFALDAWWDEHELDRDVAQELQSVRRELDENRRLVLYEMDTIERILGGSAATLALLEAEPTPMHIRIPDTLAVLVTFWGPTLDASFGAVDALIASGRLSRIEDAELRLGLSGLKDRVEDPVEDELLAQRVQTEQLIPHVARRVDLAGAARVDAEFFTAHRDIGTRLPSYGTVDYPTDLETRNLVRHRASWLNSALGELRLLQADVERLLALIPAPEASQ
jgi:hypothetical protein